MNITNNVKYWTTVLEEEEEEKNNNNLLYLHVFGCFKPAFLHTQQYNSVVQHRWSQQHPHMHYW